MPTDVTELLHAHGAGAPDAPDRLLPLVYDDLRRVARGQLRPRVLIAQTADSPRWNRAARELFYVEASRLRAL